MNLRTRMSTPLSIVATLGMFALAGCAGGNPAANLPPLESAGDTAYTLAPGDQLRIVVFGQEELPVDYTIDDQGAISVPLVGMIEADGMTAQELENRLTEEFMRVLVEPSVSVQLLSARPVYVLGGVNEPGAFAYSKEMTVMGAAAMANGFTTYAYQDYFQVTRTGPAGQQQDYRATAKDLVQPEDIVYVFEQFKDY